MPDVYLRYLPRAVRGRQLKEIEPHIQEIVGRHLGLAPDDIAIERQKVKGRGLYDIDVVLSSSVLAKLDEEGVVSVPSEKVRRMTEAGPLIKSELTELFTRFSYDQHQISEGREVDGIKTIGLRTSIGLGSFSGPEL